MRFSLTREKRHDGVRRVVFCCRKGKLFSLYEQLYRTAGFTKLGHIVSTGRAAVRERTGVKSQRRLDQLAAETVGSLPAAYQEFLNDPTVINQWREEGHYEFPTLNINTAMEEWQEDEILILSFTTPELDTFELARKKALYTLCVKV
ncbi:uncharacterized protein zgc:113625 isoform X1 [Tachysurus ichikawai]